MGVETAELELELELEYEYEFEFEHESEYEFEYEYEHEDGGMRVDRVRVAGVPVLLRYPAEEGASLPLIVLWHGFGSPASEGELMEALPLDDVPAVKAYPGLPLFGERLPPGGREELGRRQAEDYLLGIFGPVSEQAVAELAAVVAGIRERTGVDLARGIGLFGFSAGGATALRALMERPVPVAAAVVCGAAVTAEEGVGAFERATGASYRWSPESRALAARANAIARAADVARGNAGAAGDVVTRPPALLLLQGDADEFFASGPVTALRDALRPHYAAAGATERLELRILPGQHHRWAHAPSPGISDAGPIRAAAGAWFGRWLARA